MSKFTAKGAVAFEEWNMAWDNDVSPWHRPSLNEGFQEHMDKVLNGKVKVNIIFPFCGKSLDMKWMYDQGHSVTGVDGSEKAIKEFFDEHKIKYIEEERSINLKCKLFKSEDGRLLLYVGNLYDFNASEGKFDAVFDRGALEAADPCDREKYVNTMKALLTPDFCYLVETQIYDKSKYPGPPHALSHEEIKDLFGSECETVLLDEKDVVFHPSPDIPAKMQHNLIKPKL